MSTSDTYSRLQKSAMMKMMSEIAEGEVGGCEEELIERWREAFNILAEYDLHRALTDAPRNAYKVAKANKYPKLARAMMNAWAERYDRDMEKDSIITLSIAETALPSEKLRNALMRELAGIAAKRVFLAAPAEERESRQVLATISEAPDDLTTRANFSFGGLTVTGYLGAWLAQEPEGPEIERNLFNKLKAPRPR